MPNGMGRHFFIYFYPICKILYSTRESGQKKVYFLLLNIYLYALYAKVEVCNFAI